MTSTIERVAVVGAGVVGRGWLPVFAGGVSEVRVYDIDESHARASVDWCRTFIERRVRAGQISEPVARSRLEAIRICNNLEEAVSDAQYVQESIPEILAVKQELFQQLDRLCAVQAILASSTSSMNIDDIAGGLGHAERCVTVHPFNPAAVLPAVEVLATCRADARFLSRVEDFLRHLGQRPVRVKKFTFGYIGNRLQLALMREAIQLVLQGVADTAAIDVLLSEGLAPRWCLLGTFGTNHTNADGGIRDYYSRFGSTLTSLMDALALDSPEFTPELVERFGLELDQRFGATSVRRLADWRDEMVCQIQALKRTNLLLPGDGVLREQAVP